MEAAASTPTSTPTTAPVQGKAPAAPLAGQTPGQKGTTAQPSEPAKRSFFDQAPQEPEAKPQSKAPVDDGLVEVKIGATKVRLNKDAAKAVKDLERGYQTKAQEAAKATQFARQLTQFAKDNPKDFLRQTGQDPYEFAEMTLAEKLETLNLSPEQKRMTEVEKRAQDAEQKLRAREAQDEARNLSARETQAIQSLDREIGEAWKESGLPPTRHLGSKIAFEMMRNEKIRSSERQKYGESQTPVLSARDAAANVKKEFEMETSTAVSKLGPDAHEGPIADAYRKLLSGLDSQTILKFLGSNVVKKLRNFDVASAISGSQPNSSAGRPGQNWSASGKQEQKSNQMSESEYREYFARLAKGR
jgi:hypothetical protein